MNTNPKRKSRQGNRVRAERARRQHQEEALDDALKNTFPASDPISIEQTAPSDDLKVTDVKWRITHLPLDSDKRPYRKQLSYSRSQP